MGVPGGTNAGRLTGSGSGVGDGLESSGIDALTGGTAGGVGGGAGSAGVLAVDDGDAARAVVVEGAPCCLPHATVPKNSTQANMSRVVIQGVLQITFQTT